jgi:hypothetical protein
MQNRGGGDAGMTTIDNIADAVIKLQQSGGTSPYDTSATVTRVVDDTVYVHIDGGVPETPCQKTIDCKAGDVVKIRISGGRAWIMGNATAPPTDDTRAITAQNTAQKADSKAVTAQETTDQEIVDRKAIIREYEDGVLVAKQNNNYGALINASGSFDVAQLTWSGKEPIIGSPVARFGSNIILGADANLQLKITSNKFQFINGDPDYIGAEMALSDDDNFYIHHLLTVGTLNIGVNGVYLSIGGDWIGLSQNTGVGASDISVNGYISAGESISAGGNITASGNITADGTIGLAGSIKRKTYTWTISSIGANEYKSTEVSPPSESGYTPVGIIGKGIDGTGTASALWVKCHIRSSDNKLVIGIKNDNATACTNWTATVYILYVKS